MSWLRDKKLPSDPVAYHVIYQLLSDPNPEIKQRIEQLSGSNTEIYAGIQQIYFDFIYSNLQSNLHQFSMRINSLADQTLSDVNQTQSYLNDYSGILNEAHPLLQSSSGDAHINVIGLLITETQRVYKKSKQLENRLQRATQEIAALQSEHLEIKNKASRDPLTQVLNRTGLQERFAQLEDKIDNFPIALIIADIDNFKNFNDEYGHLVGDSVLKLVASTLKKNIKRIDILSRFGGEEFLLLLPQTKKSDGASVAESLRKKVESLAIKKKNSVEYLPSITLSLGVSEVTSPQSLTKSIDQADQALYRAKNQGRNCVQIF